MLRGLAPQAVAVARWIEYNEERPPEWFVGPIKGVALLRARDDRE
jgi:hypothetical protein